MRRKRLNLIKTFALLMLICASLSFAGQTFGQSKANDRRQSQSAVAEFVLLSEYAGAGPVSIDGITVTHGIMVTDEILTTDGIIATDCSPIPNGTAPGTPQEPASAR